MVSAPGDFHIINILFLRPFQFQKGKEKKEAITNIAMVLCCSIQHLSISVVLVDTRKEHSAKPAINSLIQFQVQRARSLSISVLSRIIFSDWSCYSVSVGDSKEFHKYIRPLLSQLPCTSVSKRVTEQTLSYENDFDLHENERVGPNTFSYGFARQDSS